MNLNNFEFKKCFGQNFIKDINIIDKIVNVANISANSLILEIGPGAGSLTSKLIATGNNVISYEIDERLENVLMKQFGKYPNFKLIMGDFLKRDVLSDVNEVNYDKLYVVANLPYYITTPILEKIVEELDVYKIVVMVQKEVGDRLGAKIGTKDYGSLTVFLNYYFDIKKEFIVSRNCFVPSPNVDSMIVSLTKKNDVPNVIDKDKFFKLIRDSFKFKRKTLRNNLRDYDLNKINEVLIKYGHDLNIRAECISVLEFVDISNNL